MNSRATQLKFVRPRMSHYARRYQLINWQRQNIASTKVGRLRKHSVLKSDWFLISLVILTCKKEQVIRMFIMEYGHSFRTLYFVTQIAFQYKCLDIKSCIIFTDIELFLNYYFTVFIY